MMQKVRFVVNDNAEFFHHHARPILGTIHHQEEPFREKLISALEFNAELPRSERREGTRIRAGVKAQDVNVVLRQNMSLVFGEDILFEVKERDGYWEWGQKKEGFDFAVIDHLNNLMRLRNTCFGSKQLYNGDKIWEKTLTDHELYRSLVQKNVGRIADLKVGEDGAIPHPHNLPVLGEIQFGNHALRGVDMFRLMRAHRTSQIGLIAYVAPTGNLEEHLSSGIVTFDVMKDFLQDFDKEINVPIWLIGLDFVAS